MSVSTHSSLPHSSSAVWRDYRFHNQVCLERYVMETGLLAQSLIPEMIDYSQPSILSYFCSIVERADKIERELDILAKRET